MNDALFPMMVMFLLICNVSTSSCMNCMLFNFIVPLFLACSIAFFRDFTLLFQVPFEEILLSTSICVLFKLFIIVFMYFLKYNGLEYVWNRCVVR